MLIHTVPAVYHRRFHVPRQKMRRTAHRMTDHNHIILHRIQGVSRINKRFTFLHGTRRSRNIYRARSQILRRQFKRTARPRTVFIKQCRYSPALQVRELFQVLGQKFLHPHRRVKNQHYILGCCTVQPEHILSYHSIDLSLKFLRSFRCGYDPQRIFAFNLTQPHIYKFLP